MPPEGVVRTSLCAWPCSVPSKRQYVPIWGEVLMRLTLSGLSLLNRQRVGAPHKMLRQAWREARAPRLTDDHGLAVVWDLQGVLGVGGAVEGGRDVVDLLLAGCQGRGLDGGQEEGGGGGDGVLHDE